MDYYNLLKEKIYETIPSMLWIDKGQIFYSKYYGEIVATLITKHPKNVFTIYGFDKKEGLPRSCNYSINGENQDLSLVGLEPKLNHVLKTLGNVQLEHDINILWINKTILWDLRIDELKNQHENTIYKLYELLLKDSEIKKPFIILTV